MGRKNKKVVVNEVEVVDLGAKGKAVGKKDSAVFFIDNAVPGDVCDVQVYKKRKSYAHARPIKFHSYSTERVEPVCQHFGVCGGCKWQNLDYKAQLRYKESYVLNNLKKMAAIEPEECLPIKGSSHEYFYRNKLEFTFTNNRWLTTEELESSANFENRSGVGFHIPGFWDKVLDVNKCHLQPEPSNAIRSFVRKLALENNFSFYDIREKSGFLRTLMIRTTSTNETMVVFQLGEDNKEWIDLLMHAVLKEFPDTTSLQYAINKKLNDSIYDLEIVNFYGPGYIVEKMPSYFQGTNDLKFRIGPKSFYQTNSEQAFELYKTTLDFANLKAGETVYDLYTGTGTIALFLAQKAGKVVGIESVPEAITDAYANAEFNGITNAEFVVGDMKDAFNDDFISTHGTPNVIVTDPPRDGMHPSVVKKLLEIEVPRIVYVSCNPATQARDLLELKTKYRVVKSCAVDMFPQTHHIENVVLLERI